LTTLSNSETCSRLNVIENTQTGFIEHPAAVRPEDHEVGEDITKGFGGHPLADDVNKQKDFNLASFHNASFQVEQSYP
jgi:hypothetical protein